MKRWIALVAVCLAVSSTSSLLVALWGNQRESKGFELGYQQAELDMRRAAEATRERVRNADTSTGDSCADERFILESLGLPVPAGGCREAGTGSP